MVKYLVEKIRPGKGFAHIFHLSFLATLPPILLALVRLDLLIIAFIILFLSKWRMFALHPRYWMAHLRTNAVDLIVGVSFLVFMAASSAMWLQLTWVLLFEIWLLYIKPSSLLFMISLQSIIAAVLGYSSIFYAKADAPLALYVVAYWIVGYFSARHFLNGFDEKHGRLLSSTWAFFTASLMWALGHWLLFVGPIPQPALLLGSLSFGLAGLYYLENSDRLSSVVRQQIIFTLFAIVFVLIIFSEWGDKTI